MSIKIIRQQRPIKLTGNYPDKLKQIFANRGIENDADLETNLSALLPISSLANTDKAADLLAKTVKLKQKIIIVADFDADGATACALLMRFFNTIGADINYRVPNRRIHGYGLSRAIVEDIISLKPELIITVDNGISSNDGVDLAKQHNIKVLVTDHHLPPKNLPKADVIVNPNLSNENFKSKNLSGVGVAFYVVCALHNLLKNQGFYHKKLEPKLTDYLDLVALGTVADLVPMDKNNRILVSNGLKKIRNGLACCGIQALFELNKKDTKYATTQDISFSIAPKINAAGRMSDMSFGIECLLDDNITTATKKASILCQMNLDRQNIEKAMQSQASQIIKNIKNEQLPFGLCLYHDDWHDGVIGIVAGRLKERYNRPVIVFAKNNDLLKGSARSIVDFNIRDSLDRINNQTNLISTFGGHSMAAGLIIKQQDFQKFSKVFDDDVRSQLDESHFKQVIMSDGILKESDFNLSFIKNIVDDISWGQNFQTPTFDNQFFIIDYRVIAEKHLKLIIQLKNSNTEFDAIAFNTNPDNLPTRRQAVTMVYQLNINRWQNNKNLQLKILNIVK